MSQKPFWSLRANSWQDIFARLERLNRENPKAAGSHFEEFAKHFLLSCPKLKGDFTAVYLQSEVPSKIKNEMNLSNSDYGYDLVAKRSDGKLALVQCKFTAHQSEKTLGWTSTNMSSWLAMGSKADIMIAFTNASGVDPVTRKKASEKDFYEFNYSALVDLTKDDIKLILKSILGRKLQQKHFTPKPHQLDAVEAVLKGFRTSNRGMMIMPCGSGKTLTALWVKERLKPKRTLVLVPSLALIRQFKNDWKSQERRPGRYICVCSERDVDRGKDAVESTLSELAGQVTTDPAVIRASLKAENSIVIYSTYQSSFQIASAIKGTKIKFDLVICDEAHRTTGSRSGSNFSTVLDDQQIPASKRLFMTATPRIVSTTVKSRLGNEVYKYLADMNDLATYGPEFYRMTFGEAIKKGILVDYKIIAMGVSDTELRTAIRKRKYVPDTTLDQLAHNYALEKMMRRYRGTHAVTFHSSVSRAKDFAGRHSLLFGCDVFHVNGTQPTSMREHILKAEFAEATKAVVTNARCLTEGVDVRAIDCIYFCDPRYSKIDIVQASGRALRLPASGAKKKIGYIVVPIFHKSEHSLETSIDAGVFKNLVQVVRAMADQDARIVDEINEIAFGASERHTLSKRVSLDFSPTKLIQFAGLQDALGKAIFTQVVQRAVVRWRPFLQAREFVRTLNLGTSTQWRDYATGASSSELGHKPDDIPSNPDIVFKSKGWRGYADWIGSRHNRKNWKNYHEAEKWVRTLGLKNVNEWREYCAGNYPHKPQKPYDIPAAPHSLYRGRGWIDYGSWLGTFAQSPWNTQYRDFRSARAFVRKLQFTSDAEWRAYCRRSPSSKGAKPSDIPANPAVIYRDKGWVDTWDWLGGSQRRKGKFLEYSEAKKLVRRLSLTSYAEWREFLGGRLRKRRVFPAGVPKTPAQVYAQKGWQGWGDFLGTNSVSTWEKEFASYSEAQSIVRRNGIGSATQYRKWRRGLLKNVAPFPERLPAVPEKTYSEQWDSWGAFLGTGRGSTHGREYRKFSDAKSYAHTLKLRSYLEWLRHCRGPSFPADIPKAPDQYYQRHGWKSWKDFLGYKKDSRYKNWMSFRDSRSLVRQLNLNSKVDWMRYCKGDMRGKPKKPENIPVAPNIIYKNSGWRNWADWLGKKTTG